MNASNRQVISVQADVQGARNRAAAELRARLTAQETFMINLVSSPGSGKTSLLEATARYWSGSQRMAVLVGDIATERDAERLAPLVPVRQLTTGGACHLEVELVSRGLDRLPRNDYEFLFVENVGNLVCPASHDLGEHLRVVVLSTTEGDDKPGKYPKMFRTSDALVISKVDLLPYVPFSVSAAVADARRIRHDLTVWEVQANSGKGIAEWCSFLDRQRNAFLQAKRGQDALDARQ
jgi:hydrogenase nickel incorporation protein HypB